MGVGEKIKPLKKLVFNNKKIIENYFFMTILQVLNSFFYLLIYPYLIKILGSEGYGTYIFATSVANYFQFIINFGLDLPGTKAVVQNIGNKKVLEKILSNIFVAKTYLYLLSSCIFLFILYLVPFFKENRIIYIYCFLSLYATVLFPQWFFQGIQKMKIVTFIQFGIKLLSLPIIFLYIKEKADLSSYTLIVNVATIIGGIIAFLIVRLNYKLKITWKNKHEVFLWFKEGLPFFYSELANYMKDYTIPIIIGTFFGMKEVAIFDLANKLISIPRIIFMKVNAAIFPKIMLNINGYSIKRIIKIETLVSFLPILIIIIFGRPVINLMSHGKLMDAYPLSIALSFSILTWIVVGAYINFIFVPKNKYYLITKNQILSLVSFLLFSILGLYLYPNIIMFGIAVALSGLLEIIYCIVIVKKYKLL